jgi:hypothetical protein
MELSIAAKAYFLLKQATKASDSELVKQATKFGWTVTEDEIRKAVEFLIALDLAKAVD